MSTTTTLFRRFPGFYLWLAFGLAFVITGCSSRKRAQQFLHKQLAPIEDTEQFTGLLMVDVATGDTLIARNPQRNFTPASTLKVFALYAGLKTLPPRIPALKYQYRGDTLHLLGTGDPSALHPVLADSTALKFIQGSRVVVLHQGNLQDPRWGDGWAWDDFDRYYMPEKSTLPIHGNVLRLERAPGGVVIRPVEFTDSLSLQSQRYRRSLAGNQFFYGPSLPDTVEIPMLLSPGLIHDLWASAAGKPLRKGTDPPAGRWEVLPGMPSDSLYRHMMAVSDNFIAEQLMLLVSSTLGDSLSFQSARDHIQETYLRGIPGPARWVDGSGLSRYNLASPESLVALLMKLYREVPEERLFSLMARGGEDGTLKKGYSGPEGPYLFGKTGSLGNNHNLCGYLRTRSGKTLVFSFMNNHYSKPTALVKQRMQRILAWIHENY
ncbi:D-alanyl-D-alanine carboxypeptidase/D-alanyl-D-alanine-endopeptidase [Robiginitalea marina]|uniref:D-alanyl-D-alanine carboxypeptidase n=1 Tax=Robiginitalea marina TaxID=2954105 RepID=A0ABT1B1S6_9FLAO|nr:D-alanyl-D-alanine carboxypeptidase [Robiginitalea marina]MCO5725368.1 D-alanyl-D-alanine carboxypeptidase [Robiginitalea marina]